MLLMINPDLAGLPPAVLAWAATFLLHSTLLIGSIWLLTRLLGMKAMTVQDKLWKVALAGALFSCTVQAGLGDGSVAPRISIPLLSVPAATAVQDPMAASMVPVGDFGREQILMTAEGHPVTGPVIRARNESWITVRETGRKAIPIRWQWIIVLFWGLGAAGFTGSLVLQFLRLRARFR